MTQKFVVIYDQGLNPNTKANHDDMGAILTSQKAADKKASKCGWAFVQKVPEGYEPCVICNKFIPEELFGTSFCERCEKQRVKTMFIPDPKW